MRYAIHKYIFIVATIFMSFVSCEMDKGASNFNYGYYVGVVSFNQNKKESFINQYDRSNLDLNRVKFSIEGMSYLGEFINSDEEYFYVKSNDIVSNKGKSYLIKVDKYTNRYSKLDLDIGDIYKIFIYDSDIYITHDLNKLSIYDSRLDRIVNTKEFDNYVTDNFYIDDKNVYLFSRNTKNSYLNILNREDLSTLNRFDVTNFGLYQNDMVCYNEKIYFTNYNVNNNKNQGKVGVYDIPSKSFDYINTSSNNLDKIKAYDGYVYVTIRGDHNNIDQDSVIKINIKNKKSNKVELPYNIKVFDIFEGEIYILSDMYLDVYDCESFSLSQRIELDIESENIVSGLILYDY